MRHHDGKLLLSASDLVHYLGCTHCTYLDLINLETPLEKAVDDEQAQLIKDKGDEHEARFLAELKSDHGVREIPSSGTLEERAAATREAMSDGHDIVYQAAFLEPPWHGFADFLRRVDKPSDLGAFSYEPVDTKLALRPSPEHVIQLCVYADLLEAVQGMRPDLLHIALGDGSEVSLRLDDFDHFYRRARRSLEAFVHQPPETSVPEPCAMCEKCRWRELCGAEWERIDHLSQVANIRRSQIQKLRAGGVETVRQLAEQPSPPRIKGMTAEIADKLRAQAALQVHKRDTGEDCCERIEADPGRGFERLPPPADGDIFFDIEGDPLYPDGLEYLFGVYHADGRDHPFMEFWAHDHDQERVALEQLIDHFVAYLKAHPDAFIYHYNHYEVTALKRLASRYATREAEVDDLLRYRRFVDLYKVVREALRVSEPSYSLKNLETFYTEKRAQEVATAGDSIVWYERWRQGGDDALLREIAAYNEEDCRSTKQLRDWLLTLRPEDVDWADPTADAPAEEKQAEHDAREEETRARQDALLRAEALPEHVRTLVAYLTEFHRREQKPAWWALFDRQDTPDDELIDDAECLGALTAVGSPEQDKQSLLVPYRFPVQETKLRQGDRPKVAATLEPAGEIREFDEDRQRLTLRRAAKKGDLPERLSLIPGGPIDASPLKEAINRYADALIADPGSYPALTALLRRDLPVIEGRATGAVVVEAGADVVEGAKAAVAGLSDSYLFIQGPPGAGKTYTASHVIVDLIRRGRRVGVSSNSHKAINNLLSAVERVAAEGGVEFTGAKKASRQNPGSEFEGEQIRNVHRVEEIGADIALIGGTAWLFADAGLNQALDVLFIDEAGQVSLGNLVAMGTATRNIVLVGDQMQLGQPIQGSHPGESGMSVLEYLLREHATIPPKRGIFLETTRRMHDDVCRFISHAVYDGRLQPHPANANRQLMLSDSAHPTLKPSGISFVEMDHSGCTQRSEAEGATIRALVDSLLAQHRTDLDGNASDITLDDILVVAPYNVQVNLLQRMLPDRARVGTVDKFQGQEAAVVILSMTTSTPEDLPRNVEFLYSKNRLNVAVSRAQCLSVVVANPHLLDLPCSTIEQIRLANTLCWLKADADSH
jgi:uncharacterized protein